MGAPEGMTIQEFQRLVRALIDENPITRTEARQKLNALDEAAVSPMVDEFYAGVSRELGVALLEVIGEIGGPDAVLLLREVYEAGDVPDVYRQMAALGMAKNNQQDIGNEMLRWLQDGDTDHRRAAVLALGRLNKPEVIEGLIHAMHDPEVSIEAVDALARMGRADALMFGYGTDDAQVWAAVTNALVHMGDEGAAPLLQALQSEEGDVYERVFVSLQNLDDAHAEAILEMAAQGEMPSDED